MILNWRTGSSSLPLAHPLLCTRVTKATLPHKPITASQMESLVWGLTAAPRPHSCGRRQSCPGVTQAVSYDPCFLQSIRPTSKSGRTQTSKATSTNSGLFTTRRRSRGRSHQLRLHHRKKQTSPYPQGRDSANHGRRRATYACWANSAQGETKPNQLHQLHQLLVLTTFQEVSVS